MNNLISFESYQGSNEIITKQYIKEVAKNNYVHGNYQRSVDYTHERINDILNVFENKDEITLYRTLKLESLDDLNKENLGNHFRMDESVNDDFYQSIGIEDIEDIEDGEEYRLYNFTVIATKYDIDIDSTILASLQYPTEDEITLKPNHEAKIIKVEDLGDMKDFLSDQ